MSFQMCLRIQKPWQIWQILLQRTLNRNIYEKYDEVKCENLFTANIIG